MRSFLTVNSRLGCTGRCEYGFWNSNGPKESDLAVKLKPGVIHGNVPRCRAYEVMVALWEQGNICAFTNYEMLYPEERHRMGCSERLCAADSVDELVDGVPLKVFCPGGESFALPYPNTYSVSYEDTKLALLGFVRDYVPHLLPFWSDAPLGVDAV